MDSAAATGVGPRLARPVSDTGQRHSDGVMGLHNRAGHGIERQFGSGIVVAARAGDQQFVVRVLLDDAAARQFRERRQQAARTRRS